MFITQAVSACYQGTVPGGFSYRLAQDFPAFKGHFEGNPLLPAVCHLSFCSEAAGRLFKRKVSVKAVKRAKFMNPVLPGAWIEITLSERKDGWYLAELKERNTAKKLSQIILQFE